MATQYQPERKTIGNLLSMTNPPMRVPDWQRNFSWTTSEVETFWEDLISFSNRFPNDSINTEEYFLGSVVLVDNTVDHLLLDGQQRLATSAMLLSVIRDALPVYNRDAAVRLSNRFLTDVDDTTNERVFKLTLNVYDRDFFKREILENRDGEFKQPDATYESHRLIRQARNLLESKFKKQQIALDNPKEYYDWALRIQKVLTQHVSVVAVISQDEDNASTVFETLNDRGISLSTPDLLRNLILRRAIEGEQSEITDLWGEILEVEEDSQLTAFLRHYWISNKGDVKSQSLYRVIKTNIIEENKSSLSFSRELRDASIVYRQITSAQSEDENIRSCLDDIQSLGANMLIPTILSAWQARPNEDIESFLRALIVVFVRHNIICRKENSILEAKLFQIAKQLRENLDIEGAITELRAFSPSDDAFKSNFASISIGRRNTARYLLRELENHRRPTHEMIVAPPTRVQVEHIYPQTPPSNRRWDNHAQLIDRLGNLTLLDRRLNNEIKNAPFMDKKAIYAQSAIGITHALLDYDDWSMIEIQSRQDSFSNDACMIWHV